VYIYIVGLMIQTHASCEQFRIKVKLVMLCKYAKQCNFEVLNILIRVLKNMLMTSDFTVQIRFGTLEIQQLHKLTLLEINLFIF